MKHSNSYLFSVHTFNSHLLTVFSDNAYACDPRIQKFKDEEKEKKAALKKAKQDAARQKQEEEEKVIIFYIHR